MSDYWVKPTIEQLQAELAWERSQEQLRRKRFRLGASLAAAVVVVILLVVVAMPWRSSSVSQGYAMEETTVEAVSEMEQELPETEADEQPAADAAQQG